MSAVNPDVVLSVDEAEKSSLFSQIILMFVLMGMLQLMWNLVLVQTF